MGFNEDEEDLSNKCERCLAELELRNPKQFEMELYCTILPFDSSKFELNERQWLIFDMQMPGLMSCHREAFYTFCREFCGNGEMNKSVKDTEFGEFNSPWDKTNQPVHFHKEDKGMQPWNISRKFSTTFMLSSTVEKAYCQQTRAKCDTLRSVRWNGNKGGGDFDTMMFFGMGG